MLKQNLFLNIVLEFIMYISNCFQFSMYKFVQIYQHFNILIYLKKINYYYSIT